jgi:SCL-interrupting locus protein N-terminus
MRHSGNTHHILSFFNQCITYSNANRYEAYLPNISLEFTSLDVLPIQSTSVSTRLLSTKASNVETGYLTMSQIRRIILLDETDSHVGTVPIVGLWIRLPTSSQEGAARNSKTMLLHPAVWGVCVRFLLSSKLRDRAFVDETTFVMVRHYRIVS